MAFDLDNIGTSESDEAPIWVNYGVGGIGKTTLAGEFAGPDMSEALYLPTPGERVPTSMQKIKSPGTVKSFWDVKDTVDYLLKSRHGYRWLIIDALDGLEAIVWDETCARMNWTSIEQLGFGKGYLAADTEWQEFMEMMESLKKDGMGVIMLAHPKITRFDSPTSDPYNRYTLKLQDRANAMVREQSDIVSFMNYRVTVHEKEINRNKKVSHAEGGRNREVHFSTGAAWDAKNRYDMPDKVDYKRGAAEDQIGKFFPLPKGVA